MRKKHRKILEKHGAILVRTEKRPDRNDALAYIVKKDGEVYRWAVSSVDREAPPWKFTKKPSRKYVYGKDRYVYRMFDVDNVLLYIGKSSQLDYRLYAHFYKYREEWKDRVHRIDACRFENEADMHVYEMYLVTKHKPVYNKHARCKDPPSVSLPEVYFEKVADWK